MASVLAKASLDTSIQEALSRIVGGRVATVLLVWSIFAIFRIYKYWSTVTSPQRPQIRRTVATLPPTILLKASWNEVSNTNTNIEILWLQRPPLYLRIFNITKVLSSHLSISGGFEQDHDGKSCDFPTCLQCCNFFFLWICNITKGPSWHLSISGGFGKMAWEKFLLSDSYPLGGANPTSKNFSDAMDIVYIVYCTICIVFMHFMQTNLWIANADWWCRRLDLIKR